MTKLFLLTFIGFLGLVFVACIPGTLVAEPSPRFAFHYVCIAPLLESCRVADEFAKRVAKRSKGQVQIRINSADPVQLGVQLGKRTHLKAVKDGTLDMAEIHSGDIRDALPIAEIDTLWGLYPDYETQLKVTEAIRKDLDSVIEERTGGVVLAYQYYPSSFFFSKLPLLTATDIRGLGIRSNNKLFSELLDGMGANPITMSFSGVSSGLKSEALAAAVSCGTCGLKLKWYEKTRYLVGPIPTLSHTWITMNKKRWQELPPNLQQIIRQEAKRHEELTRKNSLTKWDGVEENEEAGMEHIEITPDLKVLIRKAALDKVLPKWVELVGGTESEAVKIYNDKVAPLVKVEITADGEARELR